jgi:hypothetical protein
MHLISFASYHISDNIYEADEHLWHDVKHFPETYLMNSLCVLVGVGKRYNTADGGQR